MMAGNAAVNTAVAAKYHQKTNLLRADFDGGPVSCDQIEAHLFLANVTTATNLETLRNLHISYILTLDSVPLPAHITQVPFLTTKYIHISDVPKEDLLYHLEDCIQYIDRAILEDKNILIHCYYGVSRSASVVIAYIMKKYELNYTQAFEYVKKRRALIGPNSGFILQLKLFHKMGYKIDHQYPKYKIFRLRLAADKVRKAKILPQSCMDLIKPDPGLIQENPEPIVYRCRKCRRIVATKSNIISHAPKRQQQPQQQEQQEGLKQQQQEQQEVQQQQQQQQQAQLTYLEQSHYNIAHAIQTNDEVNSGLNNQSNIITSSSHQLDERNNELPTSRHLIDQIAEQIRTLSTSEEKSSEEDAVCKSILFVEPIAWMKDILTQTQGRLKCPKCTQKLGNFSWINGCQCPCNTLISPAFYFIPSKVELSKIVQNVQMTV